MVPAKTNLFTEEFTIEAWVLPGFAAGSEHTLFQAGGHYRAPFDIVGRFSWVSDLRDCRERPGKSPCRRAGTLFPSPPLIPPANTRTHLAVTVAERKPGQSSKKVTSSLTAKRRWRTPWASTRPPDGAPLLIGVAGEEQEPHNLETLPQPNVAKPIAKPHSGSGPAQKGALAGGNRESRLHQSLERGIGRHAKPVDR